MAVSPAVSLAVPGQLERRFGTTRSAERETGAVQKRSKTWTDAKYIKKMQRQPCEGHCNHSTSIQHEIESLIPMRRVWLVLRLDKAMSNMKAHLQPTKEPWLELWVQKIWVSKCVANSELGIQILLRDVLSNFEPTRSSRGKKWWDSEFQDKQWYVDIFCPWKPHNPPLLLSSACNTWQHYSLFSNIWKELLKKLYTTSFQPYINLLLGFSFCTCKWVQCQTWLRRFRPWHLGPWFFETFFWIVQSMICLRSPSSARHLLLLAQDTC